MLPRWLVGLLVLVPACFHPTYDHPACGPHGECPGGFTCSAQVCEPEGAPADASIDGPSDICIGRFVVVCRPVAPPNLVLIAAATINTDTDPRCTLQSQGTGAPQLCVMAGNDITVSAPITAIGSHPLVLAAFHDLDITSNGNLILSSLRGGAPGAGANDPACHGSAGGADDPNGSGGGAGGSFGGTGGNGGSGDSGFAAGSVAGSQLSLVFRITGGCQGSKGGDAGTTVGGTPGNGGGAVMLLAAGMLTLAGNVTASGGGGLPASKLAGGGGAGSGGFVGLDAMIYAITGQVTANGGGGASGADTTFSGSPGDNGTASITIAATGGPATNAGGNGGGGSIAANRNGALGQNSLMNKVAGGGGGGGGAGVILVKGAAPAGGAYSPSLTIMP